MMSISIVTPSYQQASYLGQAMDSVLGQGHEALEYIVMDGGSTDGSVDVIRQRASGLTHWESARDRGQTDAINRGFARATGEIWGWLNSDDMLEPGALRAVAEIFERRPDVVWIVGRCRVVGGDGEPTGMYEPQYSGYDSLLRFWTSESILPQPSSFWRRGLMGGAGLREDLHYALDWELWLRFARTASPFLAPEILASYRHHEGAKTARMGERFLEEQLRVCRPLWAERGEQFRRSCEREWRRVEFATALKRSAGVLAGGDAAEARRMLCRAARWCPAGVLRGLWWRLVGASLKRTYSRCAWR